MNFYRSELTTNKGIACYNKVVAIVDESLDQQVKEVESEFASPVVIEKFKQYAAKIREDRPSFIIALLLDCHDYLRDHPTASFEAAIRLGMQEYKESVLCLILPSSLADTTVN